MKPSSKLNNPKSASLPLEVLFRKHANNVLNLLFEEIEAHERRKNRQTGYISSETCHEYEAKYYDNYGKIKWELLKKYLPPFMEITIQKNYSTLTQNEMRLCCLHLMDVETHIITKILPYSKTSIHSKLYKIRKKTGLIDLYEIFKKI